jgi:hypothetical protein
MIIMIETNLNVVQLTDSDGYEGVARYGLLHKDFDGVIEVDLANENGWWNNDTDPFLVFYKGQSPSMQICMEAITTLLCEDYEFEDLIQVYPNLTGSQDAPLAQPPHVKTSVNSALINDYFIVQIDPDDLSSSAEQGMNAGDKYSDCTYYQDFEEERHYLIFCGSNNFPDYEECEQMIQQYLER